MADCNTFNYYVIYWLLCLLIYVCMYIYIYKLYIKVFKNSSRYSSKNRFRKSYLLAYYFQGCVCLSTSIRILFWHGPKTDSHTASDLPGDFGSWIRGASRDLTATE